MFVPSIIDIEASGLGRGSYPIEIGYIKSDNSSGCTLVKPASAWTVWHSEAESLHKIPRQLLFEKGKELVWVANWLNEQFKAETVYSDGWANDMCWIGTLFNEAEIYQSFKVESLLTLLSEHEKEQWSEIHDEIVAGASLIRHRASSDAKMIQQTYIRVKTLDKNKH